MQIVVLIHTSGNRTALSDSIGYEPNALHHTHLHSVSRSAVDQVSTSSSTRRCTGRYNIYR